MLPNESVSSSSVQAERTIKVIAGNLAMLLRQVCMAAAALAGLSTHISPSAGRMTLAGALVAVLITVAGSAVLDKYNGREHADALLQAALCAGLAFIVGCLLGVLLIPR